MDLAAPSACFDPFGRLEVRGTTPAGKERTLVLSFPELEPPAAGEHLLAEDAACVLRLDGTVRTGRFVVTALGSGRVILRGSLSASDPATAAEFDVDLPASAAAAVARGAPPATREPPPVQVPAPDDLVFAALGNSGTGSAVQHRVGKALAGLAASGPLDHVLLLGDLVLPAGTRDRADPAWLHCFETPYPQARLAVPFHAVLGDRDHRGDQAAYTGYAQASQRLHLPHLAYHFSVPCHGREVLFVGIDTTHYARGARDPAMRFVQRVAATRLGESKAELKIVFGHQTLLGHGPGGRDSEAAATLRTYLLPLFQRTGVDIYVSAGVHHQELVQHPDGGVLEVVTGTAGGLARSVDCGEGTLFASTEPGFAWFRCDGKELEISLRGPSGEVLHVHRLRPRRLQ